MCRRNGRQTPQSGSYFVRRGSQKGRQRRRQGQQQQAALTRVAPAVVLVAAGCWRLARALQLIVRDGVAAAHLCRTEHPDARWRL